MNVVLLVIDSFGIGALPDAEDYGDSGANTAAGAAKIPGGAKWPRLCSYGLGNAAALAGGEISGCPPAANPQARFAAMAERSPGKDTTTGHWEMAGLILDKPFPVFPPDFPSFPDDLVENFVRQTGIPGILGNRSASGTQIISELGDEHIRSHKPICYTSADSVFQIAAHTDVYPVKELYRLCETARRLCDPLNVGRVIARPCEGKPGAFVRTADRHDWSIELPGKTLPDYLKDGGVQTVGIGKIGSIFNESGLTDSFHDAGNPACLARTFDVLQTAEKGHRFVFVNLVDTDMIYGHRRDVQGYHDAVAQVDAALPDIEALLNPGDVLAVTGDHGCDPSFGGTDHTREYVPLLWFSKGVRPEDSGPADLGIRSTFADLSASVQRVFGLPVRGCGQPFV